MDLFAMLASALVDAAFPIEGTDVCRPDYIPLPYPRIPLPDFCLYNTDAEKTNI